MAWPPFYHVTSIEEMVLVRAPPEIVWGIVSDLDAEPTYWKGTKAVRNLSRDGEVIHREVTIAFRNKRCMQTVRLNPPHTIHYEFTGGIIQGNKTISMDGNDEGTTLAASWEIRLTGMMGMFSGAITGHIRDGTRQALKSIKSAAEAKAADT